MVARCLMFFFFQKPSRTIQISKDLRGMLAIADFEKRSKAPLSYVAVRQSVPLDCVHIYWAAQKNLDCWPEIVFSFRRRSTRCA